MIVIINNNKSLYDSRIIVNQEAKIANLTNMVSELIELNGLKVRSIDEHQFEVVKEEKETGDYTNPIKIDEKGIVTKQGLFYYTTDKEMPHEAIVEAFVTDEDFNDKNFFDYV